ncbi:hypothetical protein WN51_05547 [Melipona quadrifasciata]|uniref:DUF7041 domain-containing protein n=1 Tax=Melipona quadrifasciata TaxID=166423 RepID=A0A0N0BCS3_9HYME|nr:hypothetical protein WN51_05547 [Melipona quadrifasciata]
MDGEINGVSMRIPPFLKSYPETWFAQMDAQFRMIKQETKFDYVIATIDTEIASEVINIIKNPPAVDPYNQLKAAIIERTTDFASRELPRLLSQEELGNRKPSQFLRKLLQLLGEKAKMFDREQLKKIFLQRMPAPLKPILLKQKVSLEELADLADRILDIYETRPAIASVTENSEITQLWKMMNQFQQQVKTAF